MLWRERLSLSEREALKKMEAADRERAKTAGPYTADVLSGPMGEEEFRLRLRAKDGDYL